MRQPMRNHCTPRKYSRSCPHHFSTFIPNLLPHVGWAIVGSQCIQCMSDLLNEAPKVRIKLWKTAAYFTYNSNIPKAFDKSPATLFTDATIAYLSPLTTPLGSHRLGGWPNSRHEHRISRTLYKYLEAGRLAFGKCKCKHLLLFGTK